MDSQPLSKLQHGIGKGKGRDKKKMKATLHGGIAQEKVGTPLGITNPITMASLARMGG